LSGGIEKSPEPLAVLLFFLQCSLKTALLSQKKGFHLIFEQVFDLPKVFDHDYSMLKSILLENHQTLWADQRPVLDLLKVFDLMFHYMITAC